LPNEAHFITIDNSGLLADAGHRLLETIAAAQ
jgi:ribose 1,5-bisphosphokinase